MKMKRLNFDQCGKNFARGCYLKVYIEIVHENNFEFNCDHCGKNFTKAFMNQTKHWMKLQLLIKMKRFNFAMWQKFCQRMQFE